MQNVSVGGNWAKCMGFSVVFLTLACNCHIINWRCISTCLLPKCCWLETCFVLFCFGDMFVGLIQLTSLCNVVRASYWSQVHCTIQDCHYHSHFAPLGFCSNLVYIISVKFSKNDMSQNFEWIFLVNFIQILWLSERHIYYWFLRSGSFFRI